MLEDLIPDTPREEIWRCVRDAVRDSMLQPYGPRLSCVQIEHAVTAATLPVNLRIREPIAQAVEALCSRN
jgi:hypothetical protein